MKFSIKKTNNSNRKIVIIKRKSNDEFEVIFNFIKIPVTMNSKYLKTIIQELKGEGQKMIHVN